MENIDQRDVTRNQSTADFSSNRVFLFDNTFHEGVFKNDTLGEITLKEGSFVRRDPANAAQLIPVIAGATLPNVLGIVKLDEDVVLQASETVNINYGIDGDIDETYLELPATVTLDTIEGAKTFKDHLHALGFSLKASDQNTKFDN